MDVRAHAFRDDAHGNQNVSLIHHRRNVEWTGLAVDRNFRLADGYFDVGARFGYIDGFGPGIVIHGSAHLFEHGAQRNKNSAAAHERSQNATLLEDVRFGIDMVIVEQNRYLSRRR